MRIIFDATVGQGWVDALTSFFRTHKEPRPRFQHLYDMFEPDVKDDVWIPKLAEIDCLIITSDGGRKQPRLPEICKQYSKTHILFSPTVHKLNNFEKARSIIVLWPMIAEAFSQPNGTRFQIRVTANRKSFTMIKKD